MMHIEKSKSELGFGNIAFVLNDHIASIEFTLPLLQIEKTDCGQKAMQELLQLR